MERIAKAIQSNWSFDGGSAPQKLLIRYMVKMKKYIFMLALLFQALCSQSYANTALIDLQYFAESYEPASQENAVIPMPPVPPLGVESALEYMKNTNSRDHEKYVVLIFIKLYRFHIENFHQSYELREKWGEVNNPLLSEFCRLGDLNCKDTEFLSSSIAEDWMKKARKYDKYKNIVTELKRIEKARNQ